MKMKNFLLGVLLVALFMNLDSVSAYADSAEFINYCRDNFTEQVEYNEFEPCPMGVTVTGVDKLWEDRTIITAEEITEAEAFKKQYGRDEYYGLTMKIAQLQAYIAMNGGGSESGQEKVEITPHSEIQRDASLGKLCTLADYHAVSGIRFADSIWYVISIEKYDIYENSKQLMGAALDSQVSYNITFDIPDKYKNTPDLKLAKVKNGQVKYVEDIDDENSTFTIKTTGSATFVFVGEAYYGVEPNYEISKNYINEDVQVTDDVQFTEATVDVEEIENNQDAPTTSDSANIIVLVMIATLSCVVIVVSRRNYNSDNNISTKK